MRVRKMVESDLLKVCELEQKAFSAPWSEADFRDTLLKDFVTFYVIEVEEQVIGMCGLRNIVGEGELTNVTIDEKWRGKRVASVLLTKVMEEGNGMQIEAYTLEVRASNTPAIKLYEKMGFVTEGVRKNFYEKPQEDALIMWKR